MHMQAGQHGQLAGMPSPYKGSSFVGTWHRNEDVGIRRDVAFQIANLIQNSIPQNKIPGVVNDLEKLLYTNASSKEEYGDSSTLENRIRYLMLSARNSQRPVQYGTGQSSDISKSFGLAPSPSSSINISSLGSGNVLSSRGGSSMIPTPGMPVPNVGGTTIDNLQPHFLHTGMRGDGLVGNNTQFGNIALANGVNGHDHALCNSTSVFHGSLSQLNPRQRGGLVHSSYQQLMKPSTSYQQLYGMAGSNGYLNGSDRVDVRNAHNPMLVSSSLDGAPSSLTACLLGEQQPLRTQFSSHIFQTDDCTQSTLLSQQQQSAMRPHAASQRMLLDADTPVMLIDKLHGSQTERSVFKGVDKVALIGKDSQKECVVGTMVDSQKVNSHSEQSEQDHQANSADTGQSEVVSIDDSSAPSQPSVSQMERVKKWRWALMLYWHVNRCTDSQTCNVAHCEAGHASLEHMKLCRTFSCTYLKCSETKQLLKHHHECRSSRCAICVPVRLAIRKQMRDSQNVRLSKKPASNEVESPYAKRMKMKTLGLDTSQGSQQLQQSMSTVESQDQTSPDMSSTPKEGFTATIKTLGGFCGNGPEEISSAERDSSCESAQVVSLSRNLNSPMSNAVLQGQIEVKLEVQNEKMEHFGTPSAAIVSKLASTTKKPPRAGISYIESLTPQQIRHHISSLREWFGQSKGKAEKNQAMERQMLAAACSACKVENLHFDPIPVFCTQCGCRIKRNATYHSAGLGENGINICGPCYGGIRSDVFESDGLKIQKSLLLKKKNDEQRPESWVQCDKCKKWQHQICVLFNARANKERSEYVCHECCLYEMERDTRVPSPPNSVPGAKDLPRTLLSDYIEERLSKRLEQERSERASGIGKSLEEVPTAEGLVVRVISSVEKKLEVRPKLLELFHQDDYPKDYLYKSKMLMLFQKTEGVEVCLFGMYVQEFGSECPQPNHRHVYLSYLDSVKYFRPDVKTINGEALRTFVYHEILIAYLDYCKKRGFNSCYIWACPPLKGDDYILYCHPEIQKTPKTDKLRDWYLSMIAKAKKEAIVVNNKNMYDYFFTSNGESRAKVSAARLPYFDGDYWPGAAEEILQQLQEDEEGPNSLRRGRMKKLATKRTTKTSSHADLPGNESRDKQLMHKLGQSIVAMKEDFMMIHLQHACSYCHNFILSGCRWFCQQCHGNFQLCSGCYEEHQKLDEDDRHPMGKKECHALKMEEVECVPASTIDKDEIMESELFDNRHAFLNLCQGNLYQYDTLRRAKHSSMMVLYHLHNPDAPAFVASCCLCHEEIEAAEGWKCQVCTDFEICKSCYSSEDAQRHPHKLVARTTAADDNAKQRIEQLKVMLNVLVHASKCRDATCQYEKCRNMKDLFRHGFSCTKRAGGGCALCKRMWILLQCHARSCKECSCTVPRCMDLRKHFRRLQLQQESRRRAAVQEMMRQRAAEQSGGGQ